MIHIYPEWEEELHNLEGTDCQCGVKIEWEHPETVVIHQIIEDDPSTSIKLKNTGYW